MRRFFVPSVAGLLLLAVALAPSWAQQPLVLIDSQGWNAEKQDGLTTLKAELERRGLVVKTTSEAAGSPLPPLTGTLLSPALVLITDRRESYSSEEIEAVDRYVWVGGSLLCSTDSDVSPNFLPAANSLLAPYQLRVSAEGEVGTSTLLADHPVNTGVSSVVNDDGPINITLGFGTALAQVGDSVVAMAMEQGYGKVAVVDADIIYDGEGKNIGLGDNRAFATNLVLWLAGKEIGPTEVGPPFTVSTVEPLPPVAPSVQGKRVTCPACGGELLLSEQGTLECAQQKGASVFLLDGVAPPGDRGEGVYRLPQPVVAPLKEGGCWVAFGLEIKMLPGVAIEAQLLEQRRGEIVQASGRCFSETDSAGLSDDLKVKAITENIKGQIDQILGGGKVEEVRLNPIFAAFGP